MTTKDPGVLEGTEGPTIQHFIGRPTATEASPDGSRGIHPAQLVPLIPADLLPSWITIEGVPRNLSPEEAQNLNFLGMVLKPRNGLECSVYVNPTTSSPSDQPMTLVSAAAPLAKSSARDGAVLASETPFYSGTATRQSNQYKEISDEESSQTSGSVLLGLSSASGNEKRAGSTISPVPLNSTPSKWLKDSQTKASKGDVCKYWCRTGKCRFGSYCRFVHQMPETLGGLALVGLNDWPPWWKLLQSDQMDRRELAQQNQQQQQPPSPSHTDTMAAGMTPHMCLCGSCQSPTTVCELPQDMLGPVPTYPTEMGDTPFLVSMMNHSDDDAQFQQSRVVTSDTAVVPLDQAIAMPVRVQESQSPPGVNDENLIAFDSPVAHTSPKRSRRAKRRTEAKEEDVFWLKNNGREKPLLDMD
jgi:Zinc finger C-x8-C-x5-C-x3-H type (and similar)